MFKIIFLSIIKSYQKFVSPMLPRSCRYYPTCSEFAKEQLLKNHNFCLALYAIAKRILSCNQFFEGGFDYPLVSKQINTTNLSKTTNGVLKVKYFYLKASSDKYIMIKAI